MTEGWPYKYRSVKRWRATKSGGKMGVNSGDIGVFREGVLHTTTNCWVHPCDWSGENPWVPITFRDYYKQLIK